MCGGGTVPEPGAICLGLKASDHEAGEPFHCLICLDLVYKPVVQACGHIFCFWCSHRAMNPKGQSQCPICRRSYIYFPRICEMLHFLLMKAVPEEYSRRAQETQNMENTKQIFSPRIPSSPISPYCKQDDRYGLDCNTPAARHEVDRKLVQVSPDVTESGRCWISTQEEACASSTTERLDQFLLASPSQGADTDFQQDSDHHREDQGNSEQLTSQDFACASCNRLLYRPVVLNCGQVFCESCVETSDSVQRCPSCSNPHPGESVHVCLELHQYLERAFPAYNRHETPAVVLSRSNISSQEAAATYDTTERALLARDDAEEEDYYTRDPYFVHVGAGCDGCGMFPMVGDRYACTECCELKIGYDLCGSCMKKGKHMEGRFNQDHRPNHRLRRVASEWKANSGLLNFQLGGEIIQRRRGHQQRLMLFELHF